MKKIVSILLLLCMVVTLCASFTACGTEAVTPYTRLRDHLNSQLTAGQKMVLENTSANLVVYIWPEVTEGEADFVTVCAEIPMGTGYTGHVSFQISDDSTEYKVDYVVFETESKAAYHGATVSLKSADYTGNEILPFDSVTNISVAEEFARRQDVTSIFNVTLTTLDTYLNSLELSVTDFGFDSLADKYLANVATEDEAEEDLGGIFSAARWAYSGQMMLLGMAMVFLVLAILWGILAIFARTMGGAEKPAKPEKPTVAEAKPAPAQAAPAPAVTATPQASDDAIVAAITAAIAMTIESDPALASQFASGFRVVSFKKKSGKNAWNH